MTRSEIVVQAAQEEWARHVEEPPGKGSDRIDTYIRGARSMAWEWLKRYLRDGQSSWCGAFAAHCYGVAGLLQAARVKHLPSTYRLDRWCRRDERRRIAHTDLQPGDIAVVGTRKRYGDHITIVERVDELLVTTIEGNGHGRLPDGSSGEGVVRRTRGRREIRYGVRPLPTDYE